MTDTFSRRHGLLHIQEAPIRVRNEAPQELRDVVVQLAYESGFRPNALRSIICKVLRKRPDANNWTEYPNIDNEVHTLLYACEWYRFYDIVEAIANQMDSIFSSEPPRFQEDLNNYFIESGIGWKLVDGKLELRGDQLFEEAIHQAESELASSGYSTAERELREAIFDLSRRPVPDLTGAVQHSMAALECIARIYSNDENATLGEILKYHRNLIPKPLDEAVTKIWGFASENARHINEGRELSLEEVELIVNLVAGITIYLTKKYKKS